MKLASFRRGGEAEVGVLEGDRLWPVHALGGHPVAGMLDLIRRFGATDAGMARNGDGVALRSVELLAPLPRPPQRLLRRQATTSTRREFASSGFDATAKEVVPEAPVVFSKPPSAVIGPGAPIPSYLDPTDSVDYEGELAVVIGRGDAESSARARSGVFGYTIVNDVTARTLQQRHRQWVLGKGIDGFCPMGPVIVTADSPTRHG